jgi:hypothetical protein
MNGLQFCTTVVVFACLMAVAILSGGGDDD